MNAPTPPPPPHPRPPYHLPPPPGPWSKVKNAIHFVSQTLPNLVKWRVEALPLIKSSPQRYQTAHQFQPNGSYQAYYIQQFSIWVHTVCLGLSVTILWKNMKIKTTKFPEPSYLHPVCSSSWQNIAPDNRGIKIHIVFLSLHKNMFWVLTRSASKRHF